MRRAKQLRKSCSPPPELNRFPELLFHPVHNPLPVLINSYIDTTPRRTYNCFRGLIEVVLKLRISVKFRQLGGVMKQVPRPSFSLFAAAMFLCVSAAFTPS